MPYTINGIGTWYWGKKNLHEERGRCSECGHTGMLKSYDTGLYFVFVYLPLIPLGRKRILRDCPNCRRHRVLPLAEWERIRRETLAQAAANYQRAPASADAAVDLLNAAAAYQDRSSFDAFAGALEQRFAAEPRVLAALADAAAYFGLPERAAEAAAQAQRLSPGDEALRHRAAFLLVQGRRTEDAAQLLQPEVQRAKSPDEPFYWLLVEGHQAEGRHRAALELLDRMALHFPASVSTSQYRKLRKISEKRRDRSEPVVSPALRGGGTRTSVGGSLGSLIGRWLPLSLLALILTAYFMTAWERGQRRAVHLVNGLDRPTTLLVNGRDYRMAAYGTREIRLPEGPVRLRSEAGETTVELRSNFWLRPFHQRAAVLNPDGCALLVVETTTYSKSPGRRPGDGSVLQPPQTLREFDGLDYLFEEFPPTVRLGSESASVQKRRVGLARVDDPAARLRYAATELAPPEAQEFLTRWTALHLEQSRVLRTFATLSTRPDVLAFLRPRLDARPLAVEVHRLYQSVALASGTPPETIEGEYLARLATDPRNAELQYLAARIRRDTTAAHELMQQAARGSPPSAHANYSLGFDALGRAEWATALDFLRTALRLRPNVEEFADAERTALFGLGRHAEYLTRPEVKKLVASNFVGDLALPLLATDASGDRRGADRLLSDYQRRLENLGRQGGLERSSASEAVAAAKGMLLAQRGQWDAAAAALESAREPFAAVQAALLRRQWPAAVERFQRLGEERRLRLALLLYAGAAGARDASAESAWEICLALAKRDSPATEELLRRAEPVTVAFVRTLALEVEDKAAFAAALAHRPAAEKTPLLQFARELAVVPGLESALLRRLTE